MAPLLHRAAIIILFQHGTAALVTREYSALKSALKVGVESVTAARYAVEKHGGVHETQRLAVHREPSTVDVVDQLWRHLPEPAANVVT